MSSYQVRNNSIQVMIYAATGYDTLALEYDIILFWLRYEVTEYDITVLQLQYNITEYDITENICSEDDLRSRIFETFVIKFPACLPLLGFSNILEIE